MSRESCNCVSFVETRTQPRNVLSHPHFIVSLARGPEISNLRSITEICGLRVSMDSYVATKDPLQGKHCQRLGHT
jgi:hypothetical protein